MKSKVLIIHFTEKNLGMKQNLPYSCTTKRINPIM